MIPICCIAYNRISSLERLLKSLEKAYYDEAVTLIISIDKSNTDEVEVFADSYQWPFGEKRVIKHDKNLGLRKHVLACGDFLREYEAMIVLEDDITVAPSYYTYSKQCVDKFSSDNKCAGISLYNFVVNYHNHLPFLPIKSDSDVYKIECAQSWGQVWMKRQWLEFRAWYEDHSEEFGENSSLPLTICKWPRSSWLKYHTRYCIENEKYFIYPYVSLSTNNGDAGVHASVNSNSSNYQTPMQYGGKNVYHLQPTIYYDGFFENKNLFSHLGLNSEDVCIDLYGDKGNRENKRYWLTRKRKKYKVVNGYALELRPWEMNIIDNRPGNQILLYDTEIINSQRPKWDDISLEYFFQIPSNKLIGMLKAKCKRLLKKYIK